MRLTNHLTVCIAVVVAATACTSSPTTQTSATPPTVPASGLAASPTTSVITTTTSQPAPAEQPIETTEPPPDRFAYAVVGEENARQLGIIDPAGPCIGDDELCELAQVQTIQLAERPHNLAAVGPVVYATHPAAGAISRVDLSTGDVSTVAVGTEPHDIKYAPTPKVLYVADERGRSLLTLDPGTLEVIGRVGLSAEPHDLVVADDAVWVTLIGRPLLARIRNDQVELFETGGSPHDLIVDRNGKIWFSSWGSDELNIYDPDVGTTVQAPAGVSEPHHFAIGPDGAVWVSDNGGSAVVGFIAEEPVTIDVGPVPHHLAFAGDTLVVAVSGSGEAVLIEDLQVVARSALTTGLHGVAVVELEHPLAEVTSP